MPFPSVLGHEGSGIVQAVGDGVTQVSVGDRVIHSKSGEVIKPILRMPS